MMPRFDVALGTSRGLVHACDGAMKSSSPVSFSADEKPSMANDGTMNFFEDQARWCSAEGRNLAPPVCSSAHSLLADRLRHDSDQVAFAISRGSDPAWPHGPCTVRALELDGAVLSQWRKRPFHQVPFALCHCLSDYIIRLASSLRPESADSHDAPSSRLWNPEKGTLIKTYKGHSYEVLDLDVIADNSQIVSVGEDKQVRQTFTCNEDFMCYLSPPG